MLGLLRNNAAKGGITNVETVLGSETDPKLPAGQMDLIILVDVYHEFSQPQKNVQGIRRAIETPTGGWVQLELPPRKIPTFPSLPDHKMSVAEAKTEWSRGVQARAVIETLPPSTYDLYERRRKRGGGEMIRRATILHLYARGASILHRASAGGVFRLRNWPSKLLHGRVDA